VSFVVDTVSFFCLGNGSGGDGPGGPKNMHGEVEKCTGGVFVLDVNILFREATS